MNSTLAEFQDTFSRALFAPEAASETEISALVSQPGFAVYRNTVMKGCIDALQANYPAVARLVGEEWFRAAAAQFVPGRLPEHPTLLYYGADFADFLHGFPPAADVPYLADVARLDRLWIEAHAAPDAYVLRPDALCDLEADVLAETILHPHPAARWAFFPGQPIYTIWRRNREQADDEGELDWLGEGALLTRTASSVRWHALDAAGCAFLNACARKEPLGAAASAALFVQGNTDLTRLLASLLEAGAFAGMSDSPIKLEKRQ